jgi:uncharacterized protein YecA (UPF0149 family)
MIDQTVDQSDPEFAELILWVIQHNHVKDAKTKITIEGDRVFEHTGQICREIFYTPGRNDPCFCGSGKKFKKCCGGK